MNRHLTVPAFSHPAVLCVACATNRATLDMSILVTDLGALDMHHRLLCDDLTCVRVTQSMAETVGITWELEPLTREVAEDVTGLELGDVDESGAAA